jgi:hypothetical protein
MLTVIPGSLAVYAPGKLTKLEPVFEPVPVILICAHWGALVEVQFGEREGGRTSM